MAKFNTLTVKKIVKETEDAVSIVFDVPANLQQDYKFVAGQYVTVKAIIDDEEVRRAYSICASPNSGELKIAVKAIKDGTFSVYALYALREGQTLGVSEPEGKFILEPKNDENYIGFVAGSGITPVMSMVKDTLESTSATFTLIYGNKSEKDTIFFEELAELKRTYKDRFNLHYVFSRVKGRDALFGRLNSAHIYYFIKNTYKKVDFNGAYFCGPEAMITALSATLTEVGFDKDKIYYELFTTSDNKVDDALLGSGESEVKVVLDDEENVFTMKKSDTLLSASLRNDLDAPYSCQGGVCSSCIAKVTHGKAVMAKNSILSKEEVDEGLVLTCIAHPVTPTITIDFDEA